MIFKRNQGWWMLLAFLAALLLVPRADAAEPALTAEEIVKKVMDQVKAPERNENRQDYTYTKHVLTEELDSKDKVGDTKEKVYLVQGGIAILKSMKVNGKYVSDAELSKENERVIKARQSLTGAKISKTDENWETFLTSDLLARYKFTLVRQETMNNRPAYVLTFVPLSAKLPVKETIDRALNQLAGTVWVDAKEFEIAKADVAVQGKVSLGGILEVVGSLKQFHYVIERQRISDYVWFNKATKGEVESRKLWDNSHVRSQTESSDFHRLTASAANPSGPGAR
jgi:hypothetical protein